MTEQAPKPAPPAPEIAETYELPDMTPHEFLIESLNARYDVDQRENKQNGLLVISCRKDGESIAQIGVTQEGRYLIKTEDATLQINFLESVRQVSELFKALLTR
jgi:hypothetical protein